MTVTKYLVPVYGIGHSRLKKICKSLGIRSTANTNLLTKNIKNKISKYITMNYVIGDKLRKDVQSNLKDKMKLKSYKGRRLSNRLPVRGQRTRTNGRTQKRISHFYGKKAKT